MTQSFRLYVMYATKFRNRWSTIHKNCWNTTRNAKSVMVNVWFAANQTVLHHKRKILPNVGLCKSSDGELIDIEW